VAAFVRFGWCANIRGRDGGMVTGLPKQWLGQYLTSAEVVLELWQEKALSEAGLICFGHHRGPSDGFAFVRTCHQPIIYESAEATETARLAADLRYVLAISRFVHYLRVMIRDQQSDVGALNQWIAQYVCHEKEPSPEKPLGSAHVDVSQRTVTLRASPRFRLEPLIYPLRATFPLPA
jgi:type VI secretion system protein ImpC